MEQNNQPPTEPEEGAAGEQQPWVKPVVMRIPLNEATDGGTFTDILDGVTIRSGS